MVFVFKLESAVYRAERPSVASLWLHLSTSRNRIIKWQIGCSDAKLQEKIAIYTCSYDPKHTLYHVLCTDVESNFAAAACLLAFTVVSAHNEVFCT